MRESQIEERLGRMIRSRGGLYYKFVSPGSRGVPDRLVILPGGRVIFVELKTATGHLSSLQRYQIERMRAQGADVRQVRGWNEAEAFVKEVMP